MLFHPLQQITLRASQIVAPRDVVFFSQLSQGSLVDPPEQRQDLTVGTSDRVFAQPV